MKKIVSKIEFKEKIRPMLKENSKSIALCHGVFDLIHPGHIIHFEQAAEMADILVVSITAEKYVRKGPGRPYFNDEMRMKFLSAIECIDYVLLSDGYTVDDIIEAVEPDYYVKGEEYANENADVTANMKPERELVEKHGGCVRYTSGQVFSSTKLINRGLSGLPNDVIEYMEGVIKKYDIKEIVKYSEKIFKLKILVIGETIIDRYTYCNVQGLMSKDTAYSARLLGTEDYIGGAAAVARHIAGWCDNVTFMSVVGKGDEVSLKLGELSEQGIDLQLIKSSVFPTIVKHRYLSQDQKREEYTKIFAINNIPLNPKIDNNALAELKEKIRNSICDYDAVFVCDFGHGLFDDELIRLIEEKAKLMLLNCQTNSSNYGMNNITKYHRTDIFTLDQKELRLAIPQKADDEVKSISNLKKILGASLCFLTRGSNGALGLDNHRMEICPAFTLLVKDTIGAGDAFYSVAGIFAVAGAPLTISTIMGNVVGALATNIVGNKKSVGKADALKFVSTLMNV